MPGSEQINLRPAEAVAVVAERAKTLAADPQHRIAIGLAGGPGVGKSTIAIEVVAALNAASPGSAAYVPMDGFHMKHQKLGRLGTVHEKGMPHTFEGAAFAAFLAALKTATGQVSGPGYSRDIEDTIDNAFSVAPEARILVAEGNYLLLDQAPWDAVKPLLDLSVFIHVDRDKVFARLMRRHGEALGGGFSAQRNLEHVNRVDLANFDLVEASAGRADLRIDIISDT
jgi:pantothenate kinase